jgi:hypothetical protein
MRGARADAECPRCGHRQPPTDDALATCTTCGLAFAPKELQISVRRPARAPDTALVPAQPTALSIERYGDELTFRWNNHSVARLLAVLGCGVLALILWSSDADNKLFHTGFLTILAITAAYRWRSLPMIVVDRTRLRSRVAFLLVDLREVIADGNRILAILSDGARSELAQAPDADSAAYVSYELSLRVERARESAAPPDD